MSETRPCPWCGVYSGRSVHGCTIAPTLTMHPSEPKVPSYQEMVQAIVAFAEEFYGCGLADDQGMPGDLVLLGLAERLDAPPVLAVAKSEPATHEVLSIATSSDQGSLACDATLGQPMPRQEGGEPVARETVEHPSHYGGDVPHEVIKCLEAWKLVENSYRFNAIKYLSRAGEKGKGNDMLATDLRKAIWYIERELKSLGLP